MLGQNRTTPDLRLMSQYRLPTNLTLPEVLDWIENLADTQESHDQNIVAFNDAVNNIIAYGSSAVDPLINHLTTSENRWMQWGAIWALEVINEKRSSDAIWSAFHKAKNDLGIQHYALIALSKFKDERVYEVLIPMLNHSVIGMRRTVIAALGFLGNQNAVEVLIPLLDDPHEEIRTFSASALGNIKDIRGVEPLIAYLSKAILHEKAFIIEALAKISHPSAMSALIALINAEDIKSTTSSQYDRLRTEAVDAIASIQDPNTISTLQTLLDHPKKGVRKHARKALSKLLPEARE